MNRRPCSVRHGGPAETELRPPGWQRIRGIRLNNLAGLLQATKRLAEAETLMCRAARIFLRSFGPEHPSTKTALLNYLSLLTALKLPAEEVTARLRAVTGS